MLTVKRGICKNAACCTRATAAAWEDVKSPYSNSSRANGSDPQIANAVTGTVTTAMSASCPRRSFRIAGAWQLAARRANCGNTAVDQLSANTVAKSDVNLHPYESKLTEPGPSR